MKFADSGLRYLWVTFVFLIVDQVTKQWVANTLALRESIEVLPFFNLVYVHNTGAAFSFLADAGGWQRWFFTGIAFTVSAVLLNWLRKTPKEQWVLSLAFCLIISGAIGNVIDRLWHGYVIDFLDFYIATSHWPAFNIADSVIFVGAALMVYDSFKPQAEAVENK